MSASAVIVAPSACFCASAVVPSAGTLTDPLTFNNSILSRIGQNSFTLSTILLTVVVGTAAVAVVGKTTVVETLVVVVVVVD